MQTSIMLSSILRGSQGPQSPGTSQLVGDGTPVAVRGGLSRAEGPFQLRLVIRLLFASCTSFCCPIL